MTPLIVGPSGIDQTKEDTMAKFLFLYAGGQSDENPEAQEAVMQAWVGWFTGLGDSVVDMGNPFGGASTVAAAGTSEGTSSGLGGYSIITADSLAEATTKTLGCPVLATGGSVEVYEALPM
ncbi:MAG TPA: hypothetical protein VIT41_07465 [Microlunatus sp.]